MSKLYGLAFADSVALTKTEAKEAYIKPELVQPQQSYYDTPPGDVAAITDQPLVAGNGSRKESSEMCPVLGLGTALYPWKARNDTELSFSKGDIIEIVEKGEMRWRGRLQKNKFIPYCISLYCNDLKGCTRLVSEELCSARKIDAGGGRSFKDFFGK